MTSLILLSEFQKSQIEFWKPIPGYPAYDVSNFGRVRSWKGRSRVRGIKGTIKVRRVIPRMMVTRIPKGKGYLTIVLDQRGTKQVHRLVASAFIPNPDNLPEVNHKNAIKSDCRLENLEWSTRLLNQQHAWDAGLCDDWLQSIRLVPDSAVVELRQAKMHGQCVGRVADRLGISRAVASNIVTGRSYRRNI